MNEITIERLQELRKNRTSQSKNVDLESLDNIFGISIRTDDIKYKNLVNATVEESYPIRDTIYYDAEGNEKYMVWIHILYNERDNQYYYIVDEPILSQEEVARLEELKEKLRSSLETVNRSNLTQEMNIKNQYDAEYKKIEEIVKKDIAIQYGMFRFINKTIEFIGGAVNKFNQQASNTVFNSIDIEKYKLEDFSHESLQKLLYYIERDILRYKEITPMMMDNRLEEISANGSHVPLYVHHDDYKNCMVNIALTDAEMDDKVSLLATRVDGSVSRNEPDEQGALEDGSRVQMTLGGEITLNGGNFTIRKFQDVPFTPLDLIEYDTFSIEQMSYLWLTIQHGASIIVIGGTAAGKTTALNALSLFLVPNKKIVTIEDTPELRVDEPNVLQSITREKLTSKITMANLFEQALRHRPESILVGEVRGPEAQEMVEASNSGHQTFTTFHADSVEEAISRFTGERLGVERPQLQAIDTLISIRNEQQQRIAYTIDEITEYDDETDTIGHQEISKYDGRTNSFRMGSLDESHNIETQLIDSGYPLEVIYEMADEREALFKYLLDLLPTRSQLSKEEENRDEKLEQKYRFERNIIKSYTANTYKNGKNPVITAMNEERLVEYADVELDLINITEGAENTDETPKEE
ncbi:type II/IV secretion system ATPase subunit [Methanohalobium sp.]|uniref:type II/IV secretion system ATPase subunit n=1 Tax=Methanohalobium sp. TaxID=2837493 RepID=UPI0025F50A21|nr:type II/IV secretion system ATPase subunit [Methanohalobium sp.]